MFKKPWVWIIVIGAIIAGGILYLGEIKMPQKEEEECVVLRINNTTFTRDQFDELVSLVEKNAEEYEVSTEEEIKEEATNIAVQQALLLEHAVDLGLGPKEGEVEEKIQQMMDMYDLSEEELLAQMEVTRKELEDHFDMEIKVTNLFTHYAKDIDISEEEVEEAYNVYAMQTEEMPSFEEAEEEIKSMLLEDKISSILLSKVEEMKEEADVEILY